MPYSDRHRNLGRTRPDSRWLPRCIPVGLPPQAIIPEAASGIPRPVSTAKPGRIDLSFGRTRPAPPRAPGQPALVVIPDEGGIRPDQDMGHAGHGGDGGTVRGVSRLERPATVLMVAFQDDALPSREADPGPRGATDPQRTVLEPLRALFPLGGRQESMVPVPQQLLVRDHPRRMRAAAGLPLLGLDPAQPAPLPHGELGLADQPGEFLRPVPVLESA
jgi:hypothetical protein